MDCHCTVTEADQSDRRELMQLYSLWAQVAFLEGRRSNAGFCSGFAEWIWRVPDTKQRMRHERLKGKP